jgi:cbb3-type cytochrome oxidase subunit 3
MITDILFSLRINMLSYKFKKRAQGAVLACLLVFFVCLGLFASSPFSVMGKTMEGLEKSTKEAYGADVSDDSTDSGLITDIPGAIGTIIGAVLAFVGLLFFLLMIYGGLLWMLARGNEQQVEKAKNLIISAVIGLIIILSAYAITAFIGGALTEAGGAS